MAEVIGIRGGSTLSDGATGADIVVNLLEDLLARAKRGEIAAFAAAWVTPGRTSKSNWAIPSAYGSDTYFAIGRLRWHLDKHYDDVTTDEDAC